MKKNPFKKGLLLFAGLMVLAIIVAGFASGMGIGFAVSTCFTLPLVANMKASGLKLDEHQEKFFSELEKGLNSEMSKYLGNLATTKALDEKLEAFKKEHGEGLTGEQKKTFDDLLESVKAQGAELQKLKDGGMKAEQGGAILKALHENTDKIKSFLATKNGAVRIEVKAAQAPTDIATHTLGDRVQGIGQLPVRKPFLEDLFPSVNTTSEFIRYMDQETIVRDAKNVATAAASTHNTKITWKERNIQITNVRDFIDVPVNMLEDYDFVEGEIRNLLDVNVALKVDTGLRSGDGTAPNIYGIDSAASEFSAANTLGGTIPAWTASVEKADIYALIIAMTSQIIALGQDGSFIPNVVLFNTVDHFKHMLIKDANGNYVVPPFVAMVGGKQVTIENMTVRTNPDVPANTCYVFDSTKGTIYRRKDAVIEMSYENRSNFETETVTIKAYRRLNFLIRNLNKNAFMKCSDIATAIAALQKP